VRFAGNVFFPARRKFRRCEAAAAVEPRGDTAPGEFPRKLSKKLLAFVIGERERERERRVYGNAVTRGKSCVAGCRREFQAEA